MNLNKVVSTLPDSITRVEHKMAVGNSRDYGKRHDRPVERITCIGTVELLNGL